MSTAASPAEKVAPADAPRSGVAAAIMRTLAGALTARAARSRLRRHQVPHDPHLLRDIGLEHHMVQAGVHRRFWPG
ncbi:DUF1127 domain-containing protein [Roseivivax sp. CAU 1753]